MRVLIICGYKNGYPGNVAPFVLEQIDALKKYQNVDAYYYLVRSKGIKGYLSERKGLIKIICDLSPDVIHAHYGFCGLLANLQWDVPVVTTYHGSDINARSALRFSKVAMFLSSHNIFVSQKHFSKYGNNKKSSLIPCGVDLDVFRYMDKESIRSLLGWKSDKRYVLFAGSFENPVKAPELAQEAVSKIEDCELIELKGYSRDEVCSLLNAVDLLLMTSVTEGSPQIIKEAMACGCPIVSVDVGDVKETIGNTSGCFVTRRDVDEIESAIKTAFDLNTKTEGRKKILNSGLDDKSVASKVFNIYKSVKQK